MNKIMCHVNYSHLTLTDHNLGTEESPKLVSPYSNN